MFKIKNRRPRVVHFFFFLFFSFVSQGSVECFADEFLSALEVAVKEARVQRVYYSDLLDYLDQDHRSLWEGGYQGTYPGLPSAPFSNPAQAFLMAQQSVVFWDHAEFQLEQLKRFYAGLPEGAYRTRPIQSLLVEILYEFSQSAVIAFYDLHSCIHLLKIDYRAYRSRSGYPRDSQVTQRILNSVTTSLDQIYAVIKQRRGVHPHWRISGVEGLKEVLTHLPVSLLSDQYYSDFKQSIYLTQFLARFYQGNLTDIKEIEDQVHARQRWVRVISAYFNASPKSISVTTFCDRQFVEQHRILLTLAELSDLGRLLKGSILKRSFHLAFSRRDQILAELETIQGGHASVIQGHRSESKDCTHDESIDSSHSLSPSQSMGDLSFTVRLEERDECSSGDPLDEPEGLLGDLDLRRGESLEASLNIHPVQVSGAGTEQEGLTQREEDSIHQPLSENEGKGSCSLPESQVCASRSAEADFLFEEGLDALAESQEDSQAYDDLQALREQHEYYQKLKQGRSSAAGLLPQARVRVHEAAAAQADPGAPLGHLLSDCESSRGIFLSGRALETYLTVIGKSASRQIRNREVHELVRVLGGRLDFTLGDVRIVLPNRSSDGREPEVIFKMHFRHSGRETFPLGTLRAFFGRAIERAGLIPWVKVDQSVECRERFDREQRKSM